MARHRSALEQGDARAHAGSQAGGRCDPRPASSPKAPESNTVPPNDFSYFELINDLVQKEPVGALDPEIMGSLAAIGIVKGKPFNPDARMK
jgi:hypothetical protein